MEHLLRANNRLHLYLKHNFHCISSLGEWIFLHGRPGVQESEHDFKRQRSKGANTKN